MISEAAGNDANIIFGAVVDEEIADEMRVTVIAAGFTRSNRRNRVFDTSRASKPAGDIFSTNVPTLEKDNSIPKVAPTYTPPKFDDFEPKQELGDIKITNEKGMEIDSASVIIEERPKISFFALDDYEIPAFMRKIRK